MSRARIRRELPPMNILAIGAHPDDIEFGCGGSLIKYADRGHSIYLMVLTEGGKGGRAGARRREQLRAARAIGVRKIFWGGYEDTQLEVDRPLIQRIERVIDAVDPLFIFVHYGDDTHQDHRHLATCTVTATRYTRNVLFYEGPTTQNFTPTVFVNVDAVLERKLAALRSHASQVMKTNIEGLSIIDVARSSAHFRGIQGRVKNAEGFMPLRLFINID
ncbi:MAG: PIG-L deacetylase family protein [Nitrospirota bacterium]